MPIIAMFFGIIIRMYNLDNQKHHLPHIHAEYQDDNAVFAIDSGDLLEGQMPKKQVRLVQAWIEIHREELLADWKLAVSGERVFKIKPLD